MELHEKFRHQNLREEIFGYSPEYNDKFDLAIFLRRIVILSAAFARVYYKCKKNGRENMTSRTLDRIVGRPYISIDNSISILTALQSAGGELDELGLSELKISADESSPEYINLYEVKVVLQDETGKFFDATTCQEMLKKVVACINFITEVDIDSDGEKVFFKYRGETFDVSSLFKYEFCYLYCAVQDVDPLVTTFIPL